jgi:hypothetical protein
MALWKAPSGLEVGMSDAEQVWRGKADDEIQAAARRLSEYTEDGERVIRAELRRRGFDEPPSTIRQSDPDTGRPTGISNRYTDAYRVASAIIAFGTIVKVTGALVALSIALAGFASADGPFGSSALIGGVLVAVITGFVFWIVGVFVTAQGQLLRASLDTAVNSSPLLSNIEKARIMGVTPSTATA